MAATLADLKEFVGATESDHDALLTSCLAEAQEMVDAYRRKGYDENGTPVLVEVPAATLDRAYIEVGADLFHRRNAPNGISNAQFATADGLGSAPVRIARDPMLAAHKILARWVVGF